MKERGACIFFSSITPKLKQKAFKRLVCFAAPAAISLVFSALFLNEKDTYTYGFLIFSLSLLFITWGVAPYRKLSQLEIKPHKIEMIGSKLHFSMNNKRVCSLPFSLFSKVCYYERCNLYGIGLTLKNDNELPAKLNRWKRQSNTIDPQCDLFFPYFLENQAQEIKDLLG